MREELLIDAPGDYQVEVVMRAARRWCWLAGSLTLSASCTSSVSRVSLQFTR